MNYQTTLDYFVQKFHLDLSQRSPIEILPINREIMAQTLAELGMRRGAEIGVAQGEHAELLCQVIGDLELVGVDAWQGYSGYRDYLGGTLERFYAEARERLEPYNCRLVRKFSMEAVGEFPDHFFDFVYLDGGHDFKNIAMDICEWIKKVRPGGVLYGHDYRRSKTNRYTCHVVDVVQAYAYSHQIKPWFVLGTRGRRDGTPYREGTRAWAWVVP